MDKDNPTQFGRALAQLGIKMIAAYSPEARGRTITVFSSSEAVDVMLEHATDDDTDVMRRGIAIATHPRIAQRARQRGVNDVNTVSSAASLLDTIRLLVH